jgi:purine-nucleoside phosphorylase
VTPARLRPTAPIAADAILVGDPGRALMLAQELLQQPKMSNHTRGLWGYTGLTHDGHELTLQSTGMGGPSATVVFSDLAELGVERAIRIGTCTSLSDFELGALAIVTEAFPESPGSRGGNGTEPHQEVVLPDLELTQALINQLGEGARGAVAASLDVLHHPDHMVHPAAEVADMQTAALFATGSRRGIAVAALLVVSQTQTGDTSSDEALERAAKGAGIAAASILSS